MEHRKTPPEGDVGAGLPPGFVSIGDRHDDLGRPLLETSGTISFPLDDFEDFIVMYRRQHPRHSIT